MANPCAQFCCCCFFSFREHGNLQMFVCIYIWWKKNTLWANCDWDLMGWLMFSNNDNVDIGDNGTKLTPPPPPCYSTCRQWWGTRDKTWAAEVGTTDKEDILYIKLAHILRVPYRGSDRYTSQPHKTPKTLSFIPPDVFSNPARTHANKTE